MKRREKDNAKRAQSRKWYFEKADWIVSDEIEDENGDEAIEEEEAKIDEGTFNKIRVLSRTRRNEQIATGTTDIRRYALAKDSAMNRSSSLAFAP